MALERENPLPVGVYWLDVWEKDQAMFRKWLADNREKVEVIRTASHKRTSEYPARDWYLFKTHEPVRWEGPGFPTIATEDLQEHETADRPPPPKPTIERLEEAAEKVTTAGTGLLVTLAAVLGIGYVITRGKKKG